MRKKHGLLDILIFKVSLLSSYNSVIISTINTIFQGLLHQLFSKQRLGLKIVSSERTNGMLIKTKSKQCMMHDYTIKTFEKGNKVQQ